MLNKVPCTIMRGGTSKGPFIDIRDLPTDEKERNEAILKIMGSPDIKQIDGIGGAAFVTSKMVMAQPSDREGIDVDFLFAQVFIDKPIVDTKPTCDNMMSGVGAFAIEKGWVDIQGDTTTVNVYNMNTNLTIELIVQTPQGEVNYNDGDFSIDGVDGKGAPVKMTARNIEGGTTGMLFPTNNRMDIVDDVEVTIIDAGNLIVLIQARSLILTGLEDAAFFRENEELMARLESIRCTAGYMAGLGDVTNSVLPKMSLLSHPRSNGTNELPRGRASKYPPPAEA